MSDTKQKSKDIVSSPKLSRKELRQQELAEQIRSRRGDTIKLIIAVALIVAGIWGYYWQPQISVYLRALFPLAGVVLALLIVFFWCDLGVRLVRYVKDSIAEVKKVVWPDKSEAWKNTVFVLIFTAILTLFIWGVDGLLAWLFLLNS